MGGNVKGATHFGIDDRLSDLRLRIVAGELAKGVGRRIRARRDELRLTQKQVAARMREAAKASGENEPAVDAQRISDWERACNTPSERYLGLLVRALEVEDLTYFYAEEPLARETPDALAALNGNGDLRADLADLRAAVSGLDEQLRLLRAELAARDAEVLRRREEGSAPTRASRPARQR